MSRSTDIANDLASRSSLSDWQASEELNALRIPATVEVPTKQIRRFLALSGKIGGIEIAARGSDSLSAVCQTIVRVLEPNAFDTLDFVDPGVYAKIDAICSILVAAGLITEGEKSTILAMGNGDIAKYDPPTTPCEIGLFRSANPGE